MFFKINFTNLMFTFSVITCRVNAVDDFNFEPCSMTDDDCLKNQFNIIAQQLATKGFPEISISKIDPLELDSVTMTFLNSIYLTISPALVEKLRTCRYEKVHFDIQKETFELDWICDAELSGNFTLSGSNPIVQSLLSSNTVTGGGNMNVTTEQLRFNMIFPLKVNKRDNDYYINLENPTHTFDVKKVILVAKDVVLAGQNFTNFFNEYFNSNWKFIVQNFGKTLFAKHLEINVSILHKLFNNFPASNFIKDDLTSYESD